MSLLLLQTALALPLYAQRSGRTCGNCHTSPTLEDPEGWDNPELLDRKCTMSCLACHTDPTGGGLRNTSGRYFGASTVAITQSQPRSYSDVGREVLSKDASWRWLQRLGTKPRGDGRIVPSDLEDAQEGMGAGQTANLWAFGHQPEPTTMSYWDGRYGSMNADPTVQVGGDLRLAWYSGSERIFPMQTELHAAVHPTHHVTATGTLGLRREDDRLVAFARRMFLMTHELPGMSWARAGVFQPAYGTYLDDHTAPTRVLFEGSAADSRNLVTGVEVGTAPNYPFGQVALFLNGAEALGGAADQGWGATAMGGWRDLDWSLIGHAQIRQRRRQGRGDLISAGISAGWSPRFTWKDLPTTWLVELDVGRRTVGERTAYPLAGMSEVSFLVRNGVVAKLRTDISAELGQPGLDVRNAVVGTVGLLPGLSLEATGRWTSAGPERHGVDALAQVHVWW